MVHHAGRAPYDLTFLEDDQSGYRLNPQLSGKCLVLIYINFKDTHLSRQLLPQCLDRRTQHLTRAAPCRKKIHQYRFIPFNDIVKCFYLIYFLNIYNLFNLKYRNPA